MSEGTWNNWWRMAPTVQFSPQGWIGFKIKSLEPAQIQIWPKSNLMWGLPFDFRCQCTQCVLHTVLQFSAIWVPQSCLGWGLPWPTNYIDCSMVKWCNHSIIMPKVVLITVFQIHNWFPICILCFRAVAVGCTDPSWVHKKRRLYWDLISRDASWL